jgi:hypothetical protein
MAKFQFKPVLNFTDTITARLADGTGTANQLTDADVGKFVKLKGDSQYGLCAVGDEIEGVVNTANEQVADGYYLGGVAPNGRVEVVLDGLQGTPGTGVLAVGDYVVAGTVVARGTSLGGASPKVCKATAAASALVHKWRVVALYGTGAVGQSALIERV